MEKIVVPFDFSEASSWGYYYAYEMAKYIGAELVVLHLYWPPYVESTYPLEQIQSIFDEKEKSVLHHLKAATRPPLGDDPEKVKRHFHVKPGSEYTIVQAAEEYGADLIIMGTHGAGRAFDKVWGTHTGQVIQSAKCPVIAIPVGATFKPVEHIAYATNFDEKDTELLFQLTVLASAIKAQLHCVYVDVADEPYLYKDKKAEALKARFATDFKGLPVTFTTVSADEVESGLSTFCRINKVDLLAMLTHQKNLWDTLFGGGSMTKSMVQQTKLPLLAFHE